MLALLLMVATTADDTQAMLKAATGRLAVCTRGIAEGMCGEPAERSRFRLVSDDPVETPDAKGRAMQVTGSPCEVVGTRYCTRKPRTVFRTDFTD